MNTQYLEYKDNRSNKFYEISLHEKEVIINFGRIGRAGKIWKKEFENKKKAQIFYDRQIRKKIKKGYLIASDKFEQLKIPYSNFEVI